jgi:phage terminase large subunit GpA-like protein
VCIDSGGHATKQAYDFARTRGHRRIFAIKGVGGAGAPVIKLSTRKNKGKVVLALVGADTCKGLIYSRLQVEEYGPGYMHFPKRPEVDEEYFKQLTAEKQVTKFVRGFPSKVWMKTRARNEALDCEAYALAALATLNANLEQLAQRLEAQAELRREEKPKEAATQNPIVIPGRPPRGGTARKAWSATKW